MRQTQKKHKTCRCSNYASPALQLQTVETSPAIRWFKVTKTRQKTPRPKAPTKRPPFFHKKNHQAKGKRVWPFFRQKKHLCFIPPLPPKEKNLGHPHLDPSFWDITLGTRNFQGSFKPRSSKKRKVVLSCYKNKRRFDVLSPKKSGEFYWFSVLFLIWMVVEGFVKPHLSAFQLSSSPV